MHHDAPLRNTSNKFAPPYFLKQIYQLYIYFTIQPLHSTLYQIYFIKHLVEFTDYTPFSENFHKVKPLEKSDCR